MGPVYIRKGLLLAAVLCASLLCLGLFGLPTGLLTPFSADPPLYRYDDPALRSVSGLVRLADDAGRVRYVGQVEQGACTGSGKIYDADGRLCYDGPLVDGVCQGRDASVYQNGRLVYTGDMAYNSYEGQGRRIDPDTGVVSEGTFSAGMLEGEGREYDADGNLLREGTFSRDLLNGPGREYASSGVLLREGTFSDGLLHGDGILYTQSGALLYEGSFRHGVPHGSGKQYDTLYHALSYEGAFADGRPMGQGRLYHPSGQLLYQGEVYDGLPRADAFLSLSLEEVEQAFAQHWQAYVWEDVTAFVYPYFQLMFLSRSPVEWTGAAGAQTLSPGTDQSSILITEALSYGRELPGVPQPETTSEGLSRTAGWREWFSAYALGREPEGATVTQAGQFVFRFTAAPSGGEPTVTAVLAVNDILETTTVWNEDKGQAVWYQAVNWRDDP